MELQIEEVREYLNKLSGGINNHKDELFSLHKENSFNKRFSIVLSSFEDLSAVVDQLSLNIKESVEVEKEIQRRWYREDKDKITSEGQKLRKKAHKLTLHCQKDFKSLYIFSKIFLDKYTKLFSFITKWRGVGNSSITSFFNDLLKYEGEKKEIIQFKAECLNGLKSVNIFLTQYRDKFVVHHEINQVNGPWFINSMNGDIRFVNEGGRPSVTPVELLFVVKNYVSISTSYVTNYWINELKDISPGV
ncbi:MAG: hypothetical protein RB292_03070 [Patescibacteria group bacterium]|jgi:hypothetical protein|nr:hypothetical protein [Patescibacteria group bacterium]